MMIIGLWTQRVEKWVVTLFLFIMFIFYNFIILFLYKNVTTIQQKIDFYNKTKPQKYQYTQEFKHTITMNIYLRFKIDLRGGKTPNIARTLS